jgi:S1-C subfamily serine protease
VPDVRSTSQTLCQMALLVMVVLLALLAPDPAGASLDAQLRVRDIVRSLEPAIVWVVAEQEAGVYSQGTGVIIQDAGYILTNEHVVTGARSVTVGWPDRFDRTPLLAEVLASDADLDLALLHVDAIHLPTAPVDTSAVPCVGDSVITLGYPAGEELGLDNLTVTRGLVSSIRVDLGTGASLIQTDAAITLGCSGGPLFDLDTGTVVGIIQGKGMYLLEGFNFALPVSRISEMAGIPADSGVDVAVAALAGEMPPDESNLTVRALEAYNQAVADGQGESWAEALSNYRLSLRLQSEDPCTAYGMAESYAALDQPDQALKWLERAFELGYSDFDSALDSEGFSEVRDDERFVELVREF